MPDKISATKAQASKEVAGNTTRKNVISVETSSLELLIGGPYVDVRGEQHAYGHVALRVIKKSGDNIYDFGRYAGATGDFGAEGPGILRVWSQFSQYIAGENATGRQTKGFSYRITDEQADQVNQHYASLIAGLPVRRSFGDHMKEYRLSRNYHGLTHNCATMSMDGALLAIPGLAANQTRFNEGRGLSFVEKSAAKLKGWPNRIFMPADLRAMLEALDNPKPYRVQTHGGKH